MESLKYLGWWVEHHDPYPLPTRHAWKYLLVQDYFRRAPNVDLSSTMRLFLLPISTRRTFIYCQRLNVTVSDQQTLLDKATRRAANLWASWEKKESGWQKKVVDYGNQALKRIPYEEWGLKSIPPLSARRQEMELSGKEEVQVLFPSALIPEKNVLEVLRILGTEREALHKSRMIYSFIGMPISAPIALIPV